MTRLFRSTRGEEVAIREIIYFLEHKHLRIATSSPPHVPQPRCHPCRCYIIRGQFSKNLKGVNPLIP